MSSLATASTGSEGAGMRKVPFLDLRVTDPNERQAILDAVARVLDHGRLINGPEVAELEQRVAKRCGTRYAIGVGSGTDALFLALKSVGVGPGDEVITTALSWIATANAIALTGAHPVFCDVRDDLNIDPDQVRQLITSRTKAILPVHYTGKPCDMDALTSLAAEAGLHLIEDASQAFDARWDGRPIGSFGTLGCISLNPMKHYAACGEAGIVLTDRQDLRDRLVALRYNGTVNRETCLEPSLNGRLDTIQAAILLTRIDRVAGIIRRRREIADVYDGLLNGAVEVPKRTPGGVDVFYTYTIRASSRDGLRAYLARRGIETQIQHPILMPDQPAYRQNAIGNFARGRQLIAQILCIPANEKLVADDVAYVASEVNRFYGRG